MSSRSLHRLVNTPKPLRNPPRLAGPLTLHESLTTAVDYIRSTTDDARLWQAAKHLERCAERKRARWERSALWPHRCHCGEPREAKMAACVLCYPLIPMAVFVALHFGDLRA